MTTHKKMDPTYKKKDHHGAVMFTYRDESWISNNEIVNDRVVKLPKVATNLLERK